MRDFASSVAPKNGKMIFICYEVKKEPNKFRKVKKIEKVKIITLFLSYERILKCAFIAFSALDCLESKPFI